MGATVALARKQKSSALSDLRHATDEDNHDRSQPSVGSVQAAAPSLGPTACRRDLAATADLWFARRPGARRWARQQRHASAQSLCHDTTAQAQEQAGCCLRETRRLLGAFFRPPRCTSARYSLVGQSSQSLLPAHHPFLDIALLVNLRAGRATYFDELRAVSQRGTPTLQSGRGVAPDGRASSSSLITR